MNPLLYQPKYHRNLPHLQPPGATFFITFRLEGSLPATVWAKIRERLQALYNESADASEDKETELQKRERLWFREYEEQLHQASSGPFWLQEDRIASLVSEELHHFNEERYRLDAYCIMPNHVHVVLMPLPITAEEREACLNGWLVTDRDNRLGYLRQTDGEQKEFVEIAFHSLACIMHSIKRYTARESNRLLERRGAFWQAESYDRYIRNNEEWERTIRYVLNNPVKAGLVNDWQEWRWSWSRTTEAKQAGGTG